MISNFIFSCLVKIVKIVNKIGGISTEKKRFCRDLKGWIWTIEGKKRSKIDYNKPKKRKKQNRYLIKKQFKYANRHGFKIVIVAGVDDFKNQEWQVKELQTGTQTAVKESDLFEFVSHLLVAEQKS